MKVILAIVFTITFLSGSTAQKVNSSYYGKKWFVELSGIGATRTLFNTISNYVYDPNNGYFVQSSSGIALIKDKDRFDGGFNGTVGHVFNSEFGISLSAGTWYSSITGPRSFASYNYYYNSEIEHERLLTRTFNITPTIFFAPRNPILPVGLSHEIGFGITRTRIVENDYLYRNIGSSNYYVNDGIDFKVKYKGINVFYGIKIRTPISKTLAISSGVRFAINYVSLNDEVTGQNLDINYNLQKSMTRSVISLNLGLTYVF